jgi:hypothetical protein
MGEDVISQLVKRLRRCGIEIELVGNYPWIYLDRVNGIQIRREDFTANHGFNIAWYGIRNEDKIRFAEEPKTIIALIRRYVAESRLTQIMQDDEASGLYQKPE